MERRLSAILAADVVGYSRLMERDEATTFERLRAHRKELFEPEIAKHHGRIFKLMGDGLLAEFSSVVDAVECAVSVQRGMAERNAGLMAGQRIDVRIGINLGDVIIEGEDRHGEGVNIAARLQQLAEPSGIAVSGTVADHVKHKLALRFESLGEQRVKNIAEPVLVYRVLMDPVATHSGSQRHANSWFMSMGLALVLVLGAGIGWYFWTPRSMKEAGGVAPAATSLAMTDAAERSPSTAVENHTTPESEEGLPVIVVLPFQDFSGDRVESELGKGIAEEFITDLASFPEFEVVSSTSSFAYAGRPVPEIVKATGALFVIEGSIRRSGDTATITMQLIRGSTDRHLMIAQVDQELKDPVAFQSAVVVKLRDQLGGMTGVLRHESLKIAQAKSDADLAEYDYYILGHFHWFRRDREPAREIWAKGLARFPKSVLLRCKLSFYYRNESRADQLISEAAKLERRTRLDEWYFHWASGVRAAEHADYQNAVIEAKAAVAMAPYDTVSHADLAEILTYAGRMDEAIEWARFAVLNDPNPLKWYFDNLFHAYDAVGRNKEAVTLAEEQIARNPSVSKWWYEFLGREYSATGQFEKSLKVWEKIKDMPDPLPD